MEDIIKIDENTIGVFRTKQTNYTLDEINQKIREHEEGILSLTEKKEQWELLKTAALLHGVKSTQEEESN